MVKKLLWAAVWLFSTHALAQSVFEVSLNPAPYSREQAREQALDIVLTRLGGEQVKGSWAREESHSDITRFLDSESSSMGYQAHFNGQELQALFNSAGLPFATAPKPRLLVWWRDNGQVYNEASSRIQASAAQYQQPLLWPLWDLDEQITLNGDSSFEPRLLRQASQRYDADYWLVIEQTATSSRRWQLFSAKKKSPLLTGTLTAPSHNDAMAQLLAKVNDYWVRQAKPAPIVIAKNEAPKQPLTLTEDAPGELTILVSGLREFSDSVLLERKLSELNGVAAVFVMESAGSQGRYRLSVPGSRGAVLQALSALSELNAQGERTFSWSGS
ncbi:DUF2066 domain-containing protein [Oceanisphaera pacifica]|uniref:DUF2066 domain-containing protein n=1 Tax=Oceanisphaera pacifica TaxID=2818389 RepID=A0ABS3NDE6_9GAMM|nr:DUF2066 domain-containing protein [Oceanisphaera pacifica]MBO1518560.1 DUF2066 domain-containing protein [Oceanisphaera pacifica]